MRAAGAVKALRARTFGGEGAAFGFTASRLAKSLVDKINAWDAARDGKLEIKELGGGKGGVGALGEISRAPLDTLNQTANPRPRTAFVGGQVMMQVTALPRGGTWRHRRRT